MIRRLWPIALALLIAWPAASADGASIGFRMPSRNIACQYFQNTLRCDILSGLRPEPRIACLLDWTGLSLTARGRGRPVCAGDTAFDNRLPILRYGRTWKRGAFTCVSRRIGLRCTNRARHGFFLARERWRVF